MLNDFFLYSDDQMLLIHEALLLLQVFGFIVACFALLGFDGGSCMMYGPFALVL